MKMILMRHGQIEANKKRCFVGVTDSPLCPEGEAQVRKMAKSMPAMEHVFVSPMLRCQQTAQILWPGIPVTVIPELRETDFGPFEGKNHEDLKNDPLYQEWLANPENPELAEMLESPNSAAVRAGIAWDQVVQETWLRGYENVGVVSHGGTLMSILTQYGIPRRSYYSWKLNACEGFEGALGSDKTFCVLRRMGG